MKIASYSSAIAATLLIAFTAGTPSIIAAAAGSASTAATASPGDTAAPASAAPTAQSTASAAPTAQTTASAAPTAQTTASAVPTAQMSPNAVAAPVARVATPGVGPAVKNGAQAEPHGMNASPTAGTTASASPTDATASASPTDAPASTATASANSPAASASATPVAGANADPAAVVAGPPVPAISPPGIIALPSDPAPSPSASPQASLAPAPIASTVPRTLVPLIESDDTPATLGRVYVENHPDALLTGVTLSLNAAVDRQFAHEGGLAAFMGEIILATPIDLDGAVMPLARAIRLRGATLTSNVSTSRIAFTIEGRSARMASLIRALAQAIEAPSFDRENIEVSRAALLARITELSHDPVSVGQRTFRSAFYRDSTQAYPFFGTRAEVSVLTANRLHAFYDRAYKRSGAIVAVVGSATPEVRTAARDLVNLLPLGASAAVKLNGWPALMPNSTVIASADVRTPVFVLGYKAPAYTSADFAPMYVLSSILQSSLTRENVTTAIEQIYRPFVVNYDFQSSPANLTVLMNSSGDGLMEAARSLIAVGGLLSSRRLDAENVGSFKRTAAGRYITEITEAGLQSRRIATLTAANFGPDAVDTIMRRVEAVTPEDLQRVARTYLANPTYARIVPREETRR